MFTLHDQHAEFLNLQIEQYKLEKHNSLVEDGQESNSHCLLSSKNEIIPFEEPKEVDIHFLKDETKVYNMIYVQIAFNLFIHSQIESF